MVSCVNMASFQESYLMQCIIHNALCQYNVSFLESFFMHNIFWSRVFAYVTSSHVGLLKQNKKQNICLKIEFKTSMESPA